MRNRTPEGYVLKAVTDLLDAEKVWWCRQNTGTQVLTDPSGRTRVFRAGRSGMADILALPRIAARCRLCGFSHACGCGQGINSERILAAPMPTWIECKAPAGRQSPAQREFQREVETCGHAYLLVFDVATLAIWLRSHLCR